MLPALTPWDRPMAPVIRISDEVFQELQQLSVPLVDTPNSVIERLLQIAKSASGHAQRDTPASPPRSTGNVVTTGQGVPGVFLAPASEENIRRTVAHAVPLSRIEGRLDAATFARLKLLLGGRSEFHAWAMTGSSRGTYNKMRDGDIVLFVPNGTGRFTYRAMVAGKIESEQLGELLWPIDPAHPWSLVYLLDDVRSINLSKQRLVTELGYDPSFRVYGITRVKAELVSRAAVRHGSLDNLLKAAAA